MQIVDVSDCAGTETTVKVDAVNAGVPLQECTNRQRFLNACACQKVDRPPVWLMRQAGRCLPEYRALKKEFSFLELVRTPELAAEVTLQPVRRFDFDAAILFSDILVVAEAMGQGYHFRDQGGIEMEFALRTAGDIERLETEAVVERLHYVTEALGLVKRSVGKTHAVLGFAGSPWTLANFMLEGGSAIKYTKAEALYHADVRLFSLLMEKLSTAIAAFLQSQIDAGADAIQIFDSLGGSAAGHLFETLSARWIKMIVQSLGRQLPVILFSKGAHANLESLVKTGATVLGVDWTVPLANLRARLPETVALQGNLDPSLLLATPEKVAKETRRILEETRGWKGHVFNLGHGVPPNAKLENIQSLVTTVKKFK